jgi:hypothetical protein
VASDTWPKDPLAAAALVALVVADINDREDLDFEILLSGFARTAWPTPRSQAQ